LFDQQSDATKITLFDGAHVRLNVVGHHKPIFIADSCHGGYMIGGSMYYKDGTPMDMADPVVVEIVPYQ